MIRIEILAVFLTTQLSIALCKFMEVQERTAISWLFFIYLFINLIRFFEGDIRLATNYIEIVKQTENPFNPLNFFLLITCKFCFLIVSYNVMSPFAFFLSYSIALGVDSIWLYNLKISIDPNKDVNDPKYHDILHRWIVLDIVRAIFTLSASIFIKYNILSLNQEIITFSIVVCYLLLICDLGWNKGIYFTKINK